MALTSIGFRNKGARSAWKRGRIWLLCALSVAALAIGLAKTAAQTTGNASGTTSAQQNNSSTVQQETPKQETDRFRLDRATYEKAVAYSRAGYALHFVSVAWGIVALLILLNTQVIAKLRDLAEACSPRRFWQGMIFLPILTVLLEILDLPIRVYWHWLSLRYEQSVQGWGSWLWDWTKGEFLSVVFSLIAGGILFVAIVRRPRTWWLHFWFAAIPLVLFVALISPWVLDPMFNKFLPLADKHADLVASIGKLTNRAGMPIPPERMFLMEASKKSNEINAYVTGLGASKRVVVWDNTIKKMPPDEVLFVVGHEMGHYALGHVVKGIAFGLAGILLALYICFRALQWQLKWRGERWGIRGQQDWATLAALLLIGNVVGFLAEPIGNGFSRMVEHAADVYGLEVTHGMVPDSNETAANAFQVMGELDLADPDPPRIITIWLYSHPPLADRLKFAHDYDPWGKGEAPKYVK